jgi:SAM-dependent methyltransferase
MVDPHALYEQHSHHLRESDPAVTPPTSARDRYVLDLIRNGKLRRSHGPTRILELAVGDAALTLALARDPANLEIVGIDISPRRIEHAKALLRAHGLEGPRVCLRVLDADNELGDLESNRFSHVIALDILEHLFDPFAFIEHCRRVLKPDGMLVLRVPNIAYIKHRIALLAGRLPVTASWFGRPGDLGAWRQRYGWDGGHLHYFTLGTLRHLVEIYRFRLTGCADPGTRLHGIRRLAPSLLCGNLLATARALPLSAGPGGNDVARPPMGRSSQ